MEDFGHLWDKIMSSLEQTDVEWESITMKNIWLRSNDLVFNNTFKTPHGVVQEVKSELENYQLTLEKEHKVSKEQAKGNTRWTPLETTWVKVIWDATINKGDQNMGIGVVLRDSFGAMLACRSSLTSFNFEPILAKCKALWRAMQLCDKLGFQGFNWRGMHKQ